MNLRGILVASGIFVMGALAAAANNACGNDADSEEFRFARKGEACETTNNCAPGLACMPQSSGISICVLGAFSVAQTAKECALVECTTAQDCCPPPPSTCANDLVTCLADAGITSQSACARYNAQCVCDTARRDCEQSKCVTKCSDNTECTSSGTGRFCSGGKCVACSTDNDCGGTGSTRFKCISGQCEPPCKGDGDCPGFERCVNEICVESGCVTNRECVAFTRNVEATCGTDRKCIVPCQTDLECGNPKGYTFFSCVQGQCLFMGCETDKDCRLLFGSTSSSSSSSSTSSTSSSSSTGGIGGTTHVVCRDKVTPGLTTQPAR
jgi:hypothetical protein